MIELLITTVIFKGKRSSDFLSTLLNLLLHLVAISIFCVTTIITFKKRKHKGAPEFIAMLLAVIAWTLGSMFEEQAVTMDKKVLWHNFSAIASNFVPIIVYFFTVSFTDTENRILKKLRGTIIIIFVVMSSLILTDSKFHLIRSSFALKNMPDMPHTPHMPDIPNIPNMPNTMNREILQINYTALGSSYIIYNLILIAISIFVLISFYARTGKLYKRQILYVSSGIFLISALALSDMISQASPFGQLSVSLILVLSSILIIIGMFRNQLFSITAFARDKIFDIIDQGVVVSSYNGKIVDVNITAVSILNVTKSSDSKGRSTQKVAENCSETIRNNYPEWQSCIISMKKAQLEIKSLHETEIRYYSVNVLPVEIQNDVVGTISIIKDMTQEKKKMVDLQVKAEVDGLTEILNRMAFIEYVENLTGQLDGCNACLWMIFLDVDHFKKINDTYGHAAGDYVLKELTCTIKKAIRKKDIFGRLGGEEFGIFKIVDMDSHCYNFCERIRKSVENHVFLFDNNQINVTISVGCACIAIDHFTNADMLIRKSDEMMYKAKTNGRNRVEILECHGHNNPVTAANED
jgi:diguanylate cyclase